MVKDAISAWGSVGRIISLYKATEPVSGYTTFCDAWSHHSHRTSQRLQSTAPW